MSKVCRSSSARCSTRAWTSPAARRGTIGVEAAVCQARALLADVLGEPGGARGGPDRAEPLRVGGGDDADVGEAVLERCVEEQLAPGARRIGPERGELLARAADCVAIQRELAAADADRAEEEAVTAQRRVEPPGALGQSCEASCCRLRGRHRRTPRRCR